MRVSDVFIKKIFLTFLLINPTLLFSESFVLFSPKDKISTKLIQNINNAKQKIHAAVFMLTDLKVANALIDAKNKRGIDVQIVTDKSCLESEFGKIDFLKKNGVDVFIFKPHLKKQTNFGRSSGPIMHNKFALFDNKVWTGSFNWTVSANVRNMENVVFTDDKDVYTQYEKQFEALKRWCLKPKVFDEERRSRNTNKVNVKKTRSLRKNIVDVFKSMRRKFSSS